MSKLNALDLETINIGGPERDELVNELADLKQQVSQWVCPKTINISDTFSSLWVIDPDVLTALKSTMKSNGYDATQPLIVWVNKMILLDGHTRRQAAIAVGLETVPVVYKSFDNEDEAFRYATTLQTNRRNITDVDLFTFVLNHRKLPGKGKTVDRLSTLFTVSTTKVKNTKTVLNKGTEAQHRAILSGKKSINQIYQAIKSNVDTDKKVNIDPSTNGDNEDLPSEKRVNVVTIDKILIKVAKHKLRENTPVLLTELNTLMNVISAIDDVEAYNVLESKRYIDDLITQARMGGR